MSFYEVEFSDTKTRGKLGCRGGSRDGQMSDNAGNFAKARSVASMELSL
jgi:hypothetical protein